MRGYYTTNALKTGFTPGLCSVTAGYLLFCYRWYLTTSELLLNYPHIYAAFP